MGQGKNMFFKVMLASGREESLSSFLASADVEKIRVEDEKSAVDYMEKSGHELVLCILDMAFGEQSGMDVLKRMHESGWTSKVPVVLMLEEDSDAVSEEAYDYGAFECFSYSMPEDKLKNRMENMLRHFMWQKRELDCERQKNEALSEEKFEILNKDKLTGFMNFSGFKRRARQLIMENQEIPYEIWYCDIKQFKLINEAFGYDRGDRVLRWWFGSVSECLDHKELVGRVSADKMVILAYTKEGERIGAHLRKVNIELDDFLRKHGISYELEISAGVYLTEEPERMNPDVNHMVDMANVAQDSVKKEKGRLYAIYSKELWEKKHREAKISRELKDAIDDGQLSIWLQPQYNYATGEMVGAEALCRWIHPEMGFLSPGEFIPVLEQSGQIPILDRFVWEEACRCIKKWKNENPEIQVALSVNVSRMDIREAGFLEHMEELLRRYELTPKMLRLEITESAYMDEPERLIESVKSLQEMGFVVEMDDFGSGYSSLNMLKEVPVDVVKLDMKFLSHTGDRSRGGNILSSVVRLSHNLELPVIAEGVETVEQANFLKNLGCNLMQGYWFAKPLPVPEFEKLLKAQEVGEMPLGYKGSGVKDLDEVMDSESNSSFIFDSCIGGAMLLEYAGDVVDAVMVNDAFYETTGVTREEFDDCRRDLMAHMDEYSVTRFKQTLNRVVSEGMALYSGYRLDNGRVLTVRYRLVSSGEHSHVIFALVEDATSSYELQRRLDKVTEDYYAHMEQMPGGFFRYEADGEQRFTFVSTGMLKMLGYTLDEFMKKFNGCFPDMVYKEDRDRVIRELDTEISGGVDTCCEYRIEKSDGTLTWVYDVGKLIVEENGHRYYYVVITDINEHREIWQEQLWKETK